MPVNEMSFTQASAFLNEVQNQVTGVQNPRAVNTSEFVAVATTVLKTGYDPLLNAVNQVLGRTIFSIRPYSAKFRLAEMSETAFGNHTRKLSIADKPLVDDDRYKWPVGYDPNQSPPNGDGESVDMYKIRKPEILQTNFYGSMVWSDYYTLFKDQMDAAFTSPAELGRFVTMVTQNSSDKLTQYREDAGRATVLNFMGGILNEGDTATDPFALGHRVIPVITMYNTATGQSLTLADIFKPANIRSFAQYLYSLISTVSNMLEARTILFQTIVNGKNVMRHTPKARQKMWIHEQFASMMEMLGLSNTYHDGYLRFPNGVRMERVAYWQNIGDPLKINVTPSRVGTNGQVVVAESAINKSIIGMIHDEESLGYATTQAWQAPTPFNSRGGYTNMWIHETEKVYNDHSEKGVVFTLE